MSVGDQVAVLVAAVNQHDTSPSDQYGLWSQDSNNRFPHLIFQLLLAAFVLPHVRRGRRTQALEAGYCGGLGLRVQQGRGDHGGVYCYRTC